MTTVAVFAAATDVADIVAHARAALPISLKGSPTPDRALAAVSGKREGWVREAAALIDAGAVGVLVDGPRDVSPGDRRTLLSLADRVPLLLRRRYLSNPVAFVDRADWPRPEGALMLTSEQFVRPGCELDEMVFDHVSAVRGLVGPVQAMRLHRRDRGYSLAVTLAGGAPGVLGGVVSDTEPPGLTLQLLSPPRRLVIEVPTEATSRPAEVLLTDEIGERRFATSYEDVHRASWRRLMSAASDGTRLDDVDGLIADLEAFERIDR